MQKQMQDLILEKDKMRGLVPGRNIGRKDKVYGAYLQSIKVRENPHIQIALAGSPDPRFREFLERIGSNRYKRVSLQTIAKACAIDLAEFTQWWNRESTQQSIAVAQTASLDITKDMVEDARSQDVTCERCDGLSFVICQSGLPVTTPGYRPMRDAHGETAKGPDGAALWIRTCPVCSNGKVRKPGDAHSRNTVLEMSGLIQKGKSGVSIVQNFGGASHSSAITDLDKSMSIDVSVAE